MSAILWRNCKNSQNLYKLWTNSSFFPTFWQKVDKMSEKSHKKLTNCPQNVDNLSTNIVELIDFKYDKKTVDWFQTMLKKVKNIRRFQMKKIVSHLKTRHLRLDASSKNVVSCLHLALFKKFKRYRINWDTMEQFGIDSYIVVCIYMWTNASLCFFSFLLKRIIRWNKYR